MTDKVYKISKNLEIILGVELKEIRGLTSNDLYVLTISRRSWGHSIINHSSSGIFIASCCIVIKQICRITSRSRFIRWPFQSWTVWIAWIRGIVIAIGTEITVGSGKKERKSIVLTKIQGRHVFSQLVGRLFQRNSYG